MPVSKQWTKIYRFSLVENDSHRKIASFRFSKVRIVVILITVAVVLLGLMYAIVAFTPLKTTIPGYPDGNFRRQAVTNAIKIDSLENAIRRWQLYTDHLSCVLSGEKIGNLDSIAKFGPAKYLNDKTVQELAHRDTALRQLVRKEEQFGLRNSEPKALPLEGTLFFTPLKGVVARGYEKTVHPYVDITAPKNSVVCAAAAGTVVYSGWDDENGFSLVIQHPGDVLTVYKHNAKLLREQGESVTAGTAVALVGSDGSLTLGNYLHFEMWHLGVPVDPARYMSL